MVAILLLSLVEFVEQVIQLAQAALALNNMFQAFHLALHQLHILIGFSESLLQSGDVFFAASLALASTAHLPA